MRRLKLLVSLFVLTTAFSCTHEKAVSFSIENPFRGKDFQKLIKPPETSFLRFQVLGDLETQLIPCDCFMRPNGGLERLENFFARRSQPAMPIFSLGGFWQEHLVKDSSRNLKLDLIADFLQKSEFEGILLARNDLDFLRAYRADVGQKAYDTYIAKIAMLPWVLPQGLSEVDMALLKGFVQPFASKSMPQVQVIGLSRASDVVKASALLANSLEDAKPTLVLSDLPRSDMKAYESLYQKKPLIFLTSTTDFNRPTALPDGSLLVFLVEKRSRSIGELTLWDRPALKADAVWHDLAQLQSLQFVWEQMLADVTFKDTTSLAAMQKEFESREDEEIQDLNSGLRALLGSAPDIKKPMLRYGISSVELSTAFAGKNRLSDRLKKITPAEGH